MNFYVFGIFARVKAAHKHVGEIDPWFDNEIEIEDQTGKPRSYDKTNLNQELYK